MRVITQHGPSFPKANSRRARISSTSSTSHSSAMDAPLEMLYHAVLVSCGTDEEGLQYCGRKNLNFDALRLIKMKLGVASGFAIIAEGATGLHFLSTLDAQLRLATLVIFCLRRNLKERPTPGCAG